MAYWTLMSQLICTLIPDICWQGWNTASKLVLLRVRVSHKKLLEEQVSRWSNNVNFYKVETVNERGQVVKRSQKLVNVHSQKVLHRYNRRLSKKYKVIFLFLLFILSSVPSQPIPTQQLAPGNLDRSLLLNAAILSLSLRHSSFSDFFNNCGISL